MNEIHITINTPTTPAEVIRWLDPFRHRGGATGCAGGAVIVPAIPPQGSGGLYVDAAS